MPKDYEDDEDLLGPSSRGINKDNPLRKLLLKACPPHPDTGVRSIRRLASLMVSDEKPDGLTDEALFRWIRAGNIPALQAVEVVHASNGQVTLADFHPFIFFPNLDKPGS